MKKAATILIAFVALEHILFLVLEMFFWSTPTGIRVFGLTPEFAEQSRALAANQGLYNGFLAAGLIWGLMRNKDGVPIQVFFLSCVLLAGVFGAITAKASILFVQGAPALVALVLIMLLRRADA
jgi:putative membrane protein